MRYACQEDRRIICVRTRHTEDGDANTTQVCTSTNRGTLHATVQEVHCEVKSVWRSVRGESSLNIRRREVSYQLMMRCSEAIRALDGELLAPVAGITEH